MTTIKNGDWEAFAAAANEDAVRPPEDDIVDCDECDFGMANPYDMCGRCGGTGKLRLDATGKLRSFHVDG